MAVTLLPRSDQEASVIDVWRSNGRRDGTIAQYLYWVRRYGRFCEQHSRGGEMEQALTFQGVAAFAQAYAVEHRIDVLGAGRCACVALRAWAFGLRALGVSVPAWRPEREMQPLPPLLVDYCHFRRRHAGVTESTIRHDLRDLSAFMSFACADGRPLEELQIADVDEFVAAAGHRLSRKTLARACSAIRVFLRFLHHTGRLPHDLASSVASPVVRLAERPPRALSWEDVRRLLDSIDVGRRAGRRERALLLMMATYGMGAAEVLHLRLDDIDWRAGTLRVVRPKTGAESLLPLLPAVGDALLSYLRDGRPGHATTRRVFVAAVQPHGPMSSSAVRHMIRARAHAVGLSAARLGGHVLRHSHATRQVELGVPIKVLGDILGHRDPASTSAYVRVATSRLRGLALPVPR